MQEENIFPTIIDHHVRIRGDFPLSDITRLIDDLQNLLICNVATEPTTTFSYFDSCNDPNVQTIEIDQKMLIDLEELINIKPRNRSITKTLLTLIEFYQGANALNLVFTPDALKDGYTFALKYPSQLAQQLRHRQLIYATVRVAMHEDGRCGVFCRKEDHLPHRAFLSQLADRLKNERVLAINTDTLPPSYQHNRALLKQQLKRKFPDQEIVTLPQAGRVVISLRA
jgi:hypothetical protein